MRASSLRRSTWLTTAAIRSTLALGSRSSSVKIARTCAPVTAGVSPPPPQALHLQEPQGQQRPRHVMVPPHPTPHLVMTQPHFALAFFQQLLHVVPLPMHLRQHRAPFVPRVAQGVPRPRFLLTRPHHDPPLARPDVA